MNIKALMEKRAELQARMEELLNGAETENRALSAEETAEFDAAENEIRAIDETIARAERARNLPAAQQEPEERAVAEERAFADYIRGKITEMRTGEQNITMGNNGAIIPTSIANRIIVAVKDRCPILAGSDLYHVKGKLQIPVYGDAEGHNIAVGYQTEFTAITADAGKFSSVDLAGFLAGALTLIGRSVVNNSDFDVVSFIIEYMADAIAMWIEGELLNGAGGTDAVQGALNTTNVVTATAAAAISVDDLITLQSKVKQAYQTKACWTMNPDTFAAVKKLKDNTGRLLLQENITGAFPYILLGKPVYLSDNMPKIATKNKSVLYGDYSGLSVNLREDIGIEVLREKYADKHALGVISWFEIDAKVSNSAKLAVLQQA